MGSETLKATRVPQNPAWWGRQELRVLEEWWGALGPGWETHRNPSWGPHGGLQVGREGQLWSGARERIWEPVDRVQVWETLRGLQEDLVTCKKLKKVHG